MAELIEKTAAKNIKEGDRVLLTGKAVEVTSSQKSVYGDLWFLTLHTDTPASKTLSMHVHQSERFEIIRPLPSYVAGTAVRHKATNTALLRQINPSRWVGPEGTTGHTDGEIRDLIESGDASLLYDPRRN